MKICKLVSTPAKKTIFVSGEPSYDMLILLKEKLSFVDDSGKKLKLIHPGGSVGGMGMLTGKPSSARVRTFGRNPHQTCDSDRGSEERQRGTYQFILQPGSALE